MRSKAEPLTRNIRKPGIVGNFKFSTFNKNFNGLISWSFEIPASAYCQPLAAILGLMIQSRESFIEFI